MTSKLKLGSLPAPVEHRPGDALYDEPPYPRTCLGCGEGWPCAAAAAARSARHDTAGVHERGLASKLCATCGFTWPCPVTLRRRSLEDGERALLSLVGFGCHVEAFEGGTWQASKGGLVVDFGYDQHGRRTFTALNWKDRRPYTVEISIDDVDPAGLTLPRGDLMRDEARRLAGYVHSQLGGVAGGDEVRWLQLAVNLMEGAT